MIGEDEGQIQRRSAIVSRAMELHVPARIEHGVEATALADTLGSHAYAPLILTPVLGRTAVILVLLTTPCVRVGGLGSELVANLPRRAAMGSAGVAFVVCAFVLSVFATAGALATVYLLRRFMIAHLGGCTGDTLGATVEVVEAVILVTETSGL